MAGNEGDGRRGAAGNAMPSWLRMANRVIVALQRVGVTFGPMHLLTVPGRKTGKPRTTPVSVVTVHGTRYLVQAFPGASWVANARAAGTGVLARGRRKTTVRLTLLSVAERPAILRDLPSAVAGEATLFVKNGMVSSSDPDGFAAAAPRIAVFRIDEASAQAGSAVGAMRGAGR